MDGRHTTNDKISEITSEIKEIKKSCQGHKKDNSSVLIDVATMKTDVDYIKKKLDEIVNTLWQMQEKIENVNDRKVEITEFSEVKENVESLKKLEKIAIKVDEMHSFFSGARFLQKSIIWVFTAAGIIAGGILAVKELLKK